MKRELLVQANYRYNFDRDMYVNRNQKKAFSIEYVDDTPETEIANKIQEKTDSSSWTIYTNLALPDGIKRELERVLG